MHRLSWIEGKGESSRGRVLEVRCSGRSWIAPVPEHFGVLAAYLDWAAWYRSQYGKDCEPAMGRVFRDGRAQSRLRALAPGDGG